MERQNVEGAIRPAVICHVRFWEFTVTHRQPLCVQLKRQLNSLVICILLWLIAVF